MEIKHLNVRNFRGIKELDWYLPCKYICLIGPGDSSKTTILDAIEYALYPSYTISFDDTDFYDCNTDQPIEVFVSIADLPEEFHEDSKFGLYLRGFEDNKIVDETEGENLILTIKLTVNNDLEPVWTVFVERDIDIKEISNRMREKLGMMRIGPQLDRHFTWGRGSILNKWSENIDQAKSMIAEAVRKAKEGFDDKKIQDLPEVISRISSASAKFGVNPKGSYKAHLDTKSISFGYGAISLNDDKIPVRQLGSGSKKLLASSLQVESTKEGAILLFDEIETGLEPHRLRNLIRVLKKELEQKGQIISTTHSSIAIVEFDIENLVIIKNNNGVISCKSIPVEVQNVVRKVPEALLSKKALVCEGATEFGFMLAFEDYLVSQRCDNFGYKGITVVDGKGDTFKQVCKVLKTLGYSTSSIIDSDRLDDVEIDELKQLGIKIIHWADKVSIEERVFLDLPENKLNVIVEHAYRMKRKDGEENAKQSLLDSINSKLESRLSTFEEIADYQDKPLLRKALGELAKNNRWFKRPDKGKKFGELVFASFNEMHDKDMYLKMEQLKSWLYE